MQKQGYEGERSDKNALMSKLRGFPTKTKDLNERGRPWKFFFKTDRIPPHSMFGAGPFSMSLVQLASVLLRFVLHTMHSEGGTKERDKERERERERKKRGEREGDWPTNRPNNPIDKKN